MGDVGDFFRALKQERQQAREERLDRNEEHLNETRDGLGSLGLRLVRKNEYHYHLVDVDSGRVIAQWWPSSGKTMDGQRRGQMCRTGKQLVAWMRDKLRKEARRG